MRFLMTLFALALVLAVGCTDDDDEGSALALGPGGEPCAPERIDAERVRVVCANGDSAIAYVDE